MIGIATETTGPEITDTNGTAASVSVAIATHVGWPSIRKCVRSLEVATAAVNGELVIADVSGGPPPADIAKAPTTRWLTFPRGSIFSVRAALLEACRGEVICLTEDHCIVEPDWALALRNLHRRYPNALSIGGAVENTADGGPVDWASYFVVQADVLPPIKAGGHSRLAHANVSYKRKALEQAKKVEGLGLLDSFHQRALSDTPGAIRLDPAPVVWHDQARSVGYFVRQHFHAGRTFGGFVRATGGRRLLFRLLGAPAVPLLRLVHASMAAHRSRYADRLQAALPYMLLLLFCQVTGQVTGLLFGAGNSPQFVEG